MAESYNAKFSALYIETSTILNEDDKKRLEDNLNLCKRFWGKNLYFERERYSLPSFKLCKNGRCLLKLLSGRSGEKSNSIFTPPGFVGQTYRDGSRY